MSNDADLHHDGSDVNVRAVLTFGAILVVTTAVVGVLVFLLFGYFQRREEQSGARDFPLAVEQQNRMPPEPRLQTNPREDLRLMRQRDDAILNSYGLDRDTGAVRIPIQEAMKLIVQRGLPARRGSEPAR
jgi:hypothetical protein